MVVRRGLILLLIEQRLKSGFLLGTSLEDQEHSIQR